jgi:endonuclease G
MSLPKNLLLKKIALLLFSFLAIQILAFGQQEAKTIDEKKIILRENDTWFLADSNSVQKKSIPISKLEIPRISSKDQIITHTGYSLLYNEKYEQANWVAYELTKEETIKKFERTNKFVEDPKVKTGSATQKDYAGFGYDRGHLAPASDMGWSSTVMAESFYYSNMSPQNPSFNRGIWKRIEELMRTWAVENDGIYIVTGPVLSGKLQTIGENKVAVPDYFYKAILDYRAPNLKAIGFIIPNKGSSEPLYNYAVTIDSVEKFTGIDLFPALPIEEEEHLEKTLCLNCWTWKSSTTTSTKGGVKTTTSVQCNGKTKAGNRCNNKTLATSGFCYLHQAQQGNQSNQQITPSKIKSERKSVSVQCLGTTKAGNRCKHKTYSANSKCFQHGGN